VDDIDTAVHGNGRVRRRQGQLRKIKVSFCQHDESMVVPSIHDPPIFFGWWSSWPQLEGPPYGGGRVLEG